MKKPNLNHLSSNVKKQRKQLNLSRESLAKKASVNYNTIIKIESGANKNPTIKTLIGFAKVFKLSVDDLIC